MKHYLQDIAKKRFDKDLDQMPKREQRVIEHFNDRLPISHDTNEEFETEMTFGQKLADKVAKFGGSWTFIIIFGLILLSWVLLNALLLAPGRNLRSLSVYSAQSFSFDARFYLGTDNFNVAESPIGQRPTQCRSRLPS